MPFTAPGGKFVTEETLFLPLSEDGINVSEILEYLLFSRDHRSRRKLADLML